MQPKATDARSPSRYFLLLFGLCVPVWVVGAKFDIQLFPGFKLFQAGLAMPIIAALLLTNREQGWAGIAALLRRTYDVGKIEPRIWFLPSWSFFGARRRWRDSGSVDRRGLESQALVSDADALDAASRARDRTIATAPELKQDGFRSLPEQAAIVDWERSPGETRLERQYLKFADYRWLDDELSRSEST